jgi:hypothetical protein
MTSPNDTSQGTALVWWSPTHTCWRCKVGENITHHYNEVDAISYGQAATNSPAHSSSLIVGHWA